MHDQNSQEDSNIKFDSDANPNDITNVERIVTNMVIDNDNDVQSVDVHQINQSNMNNSLLNNKNNN